MGADACANIASSAPRRSDVTPPQLLTCIAAVEAPQAHERLPLDQTHDYGVAVVGDRGGRREACSRSDNEIRWYA